MSSAAFERMHTKVSLLSRLPQAVCGGVDFCLRFFVCVSLPSDSRCSSGWEEGILSTTTENTTNMYGALGGVHDIRRNPINQANQSSQSNPFNQLNQFNPITAAPENAQGLPTVPGQTAAPGSGHDEARSGSDHTRSVGIEPPEVSRIRMKIPAMCKFMDENKQLSNERCGRFTADNIETCSIDGVIKYIKYLVSLASRMDNQDLEMPQSMGAGVCKQWLDGRCTFGDQCRFKHESDPKPKWFKPQGLAARATACETLFVASSVFKHGDESSHEKALREKFGKHGDVVEVSIGKKSAAEGAELRGFAFVRFADKKQAEAALKAMDNTKIDGERVLVRYKNSA